MKYELIYQASEAGQPFDPAAVEQQLAARGAAQRPDGAWVWKLPPGEVELFRVLENGACVGVDLKVPLTEKTELVRAAVSEGALLAVAAGVRLVDPHLNKTLGPLDGELVADEYLRTARYAGEYLGVPEAVHASFDGSRQEASSSGLSGKILLVFVVFVVAMYVAWRVVVGG